MDQLHLDEILARIESAFGEELPFSTGDITGADREALKRVFGDSGYRCYLQDQVDRQIIRDYLTNAVVLGYIPEQQLADFSEQIASREGRAALSLHMLMSSVEQAAELLGGSGPERLNVLKPGPDSPPYITLVRN